MSLLKHVIDKVASSDLFDESWYLSIYADAAMMSISAAEHYVRIGADLMRDPGPSFSTRYYLEQYHDVAKAQINPLFHYLAHGRSEGRRPLPPTSRQVALVPESDRGTPGPALDAELVALARNEFDADYYRKTYSIPDTADAFEHYMRSDWREGFNPNRGFSISDYLVIRPDVLAEKPPINPYMHYLKSGRSADHRMRVAEWVKERGEYRPKVSVIIPNYNHAPFLAQRIDSVLAQTYRNFDVIILDDCSSDGSRHIIAAYCRRFPDRIRCVFNEENAGNVFRQWRRGVEAVDGELVWICESDDYCEPDFLDKLVPSLTDRSVNLAFGRIQFCDREGLFKPGLDQYREGAEPGIWKQALIRPASQWFCRGFGVNNVIANVGGCLWRRQRLSDAVWSEAQSYRVLGDWFLYCHLAGGGQIAYEPEAVAYFRQHGNNTSVSAFSTPEYYAEHQRLMTLLKQRWPIPERTVRRFMANIEHQYRHFKVAETYGEIARYVDAGVLLAQRREQPHIVIAFLGFYPGGGELLPVHLANALHEKGCLVSMLACRSVGDNNEMRLGLDSAIPVYEMGAVQIAGMDGFLHQAGVSLVHSHMVSCEWEFFGKGHEVSVPYLVTLHGSYEACSVPADLVERFAAQVTHWVYTTERNLEPLGSAFKGSPERFSKLPNGMPADPRPFPMSREQLGIPEASIVFTLVARGILRKGWRASVDAFTQLRARYPSVRMHLLLCGDGPETKRLQALHGSDPNMTFLGYQSCIDGLYRLSDCAIVPTRFAGESFPLCLIQALRVGTPVVATRIGSIEEMVGVGTDAAGILIEPLRDTDALAEALMQGMEVMLDGSRRTVFARQAVKNSEHYAIGNVADAYLGLYGRLVSAAAGA